MVMRLVLLVVCDGLVLNEDGEKEVGGEDVVNILWIRIWLEWIRLFRLLFEFSCINGVSLVFILI